MSKVRLYGNTSGYVDLQAPDVAGDVTITLPNATGPFALESYVDAAVAAIPAIAGIGSNVVQAVKTDTFTTASTSMTDVTGMTVTITPSSDTSKVLIVGTFLLANSGNSSLNVNLLRGATDIAKSVGGSTNNTLTLAGNVSGVGWQQYGAIHFLDSPGVNTATTYKLQMSVSANTGYMGRFSGSDNRAVSVITAIEVAA